jgi:hypothetical protein
VEIAFQERPSLLCQEFAGAGYFAGFREFQNSMRYGGVILLDDVDHPDHASGVAGNGKTHRIGCVSAREPFASGPSIAAVAQFALLEVGRFDDLVRAGVAGSTPGIA